MRESLIGEAVNTLSSAVEDVTDALTDTGSSSGDGSKSKSSSSASDSRASGSTASSTGSSTPATSTRTPAVTTPTPTSSFDSSSRSGSSSLSDAESEPWSESSSASGSLSNVEAGSKSEISNSGGWNESDQSSTQLSNSGSSSQGSVVIQVHDQSLNTKYIVIIVISALTAVLLVALLLCRYRLCRKSSRKSRSPTSGQHYAAEPGVVPVANPGRPERFDTSLSGLFTPFHTADLETHGMDSDSSEDTGGDSASSSSFTQTELWEDAAITAVRLPLEKISRHKLISRGGHGEVYKGSYRGSTVAIKILLPDKRKDMAEINVFLAEIKMMTSIEHERIVRFVGAAWDQLADLCSVSEFMEGGDLHALLKHFEKNEHRDHGFDLGKARIALNVAHALTYLHSLEPVVVHRDLKSMNILLTSRLEAKLTDFGVSRKWELDTMTAGVGTSLWMAPEVMLGKRYGPSADIFSFGVVLSELDTHQPPYASAREASSGRKVPSTALMELISLGRLSIEFSSNAPQAVLDLGRACTDLNPAARPNAGEVLYQLQLIRQMYEGYTL